mgnify:CR=1 FL=1
MNLRLMLLTSSLLVLVPCARAADDHRRPAPRIRSRCPSCHPRHGRAPPGVRGPRARAGSSWSIGFSMNRAPESRKKVSSGGRHIPSSAGGLRREQPTPPEDDENLVHQRAWRNPHRVPTLPWGDVGGSQWPHCGLGAHRAHVHGMSVRHQPQQRGLAATTTPSINMRHDEHRGPPGPIPYRLIYDAGRVLAIATSQVYANMLRQ